MGSKKAMQRAWGLTLGGLCLWLAAAWALDGGHLLLFVPLFGGLIGVLWLGAAWSWEDAA